MEEDQNDIPGAENPAAFTGLKLGEVKKTAAGFGAVIVSGKQLLAGPGLLRGLKALSQLNQKGGFDCLS
ncbi:MAG: hypothetical protein ACO1NZ_15410, partial [Adhaeribacter sp.]